MTRGATSPLFHWLFTDSTKPTMSFTDLTQAEIDAMTAEEYSNFLAFGALLAPEVPEDEYQAYLDSYRQYDL